MRWLTVVGLLAASAAGFLPQSFRLQSTAGVWYDDYDLMFDPALLLDVDGHRIYTNLSNYVTGSEAQFGTNRSNFFLAGGSARLGAGLAPGGVFDHYGFEQPLFTGLFSPDSLDSLFGSARSTWVEWLDPDTNGTYDYKHVEVTERNAWRSGAGNDLYVASGFRLGENARLGAGFTWDAAAVSGVDPGSDFVLRQYDSSLVGGRLTWLHSDTARHSWRANGDTKRLTLSGWFELGEERSLGVAAAPALLSRDNTSDRTDRAFTDYNPGQAAPTDFRRLQAADRSKLPYGGFEVPLTLGLRAMSEGLETWLWLGGFFRAEELKDDAAADYTASFQRPLNPGDSTGVDTVSHRYRGASGSQGLNARLRRLHRLGGTLDLGWGCDLGWTRGADSLFDTLSERHVVGYDNGDSLRTVEDYVQTTTTAESWLRRTTSTSVSVSLPVGLEFRVARPVALRLGARPTLIWEEGVTTSQLLAFAPRKTRVEYGDGSFSERIDEVQRNPSSSETRRGLSQTTELTYGAGFRPVENLQIDLMGFANLVNLTGWRLSATLRF